LPTERLWLSDHVPCISLLADSHHIFTTAVMTKCHTLSPEGACAAGDAGR
jgi:hypothetical protein